MPLILKNNMAEILFEDASVIVVKKPAGVESQRGKTFAMDLESELRNYLAEKKRSVDAVSNLPYLGVVHRLDRPVAGIMVYAKTKSAAAKLSRQFCDHSAHKIYEALILGSLFPEKGVLTDWLETDARTNVTRVVKNADKAAKQACLEYCMIKKEDSVFSVEEQGNKEVISIAGKIAGTCPAGTGSKLYAVQIRLITGRHHQIRVQLANAGTPVFGDSRYGVPISGTVMNRTIALCATTLTFCHPVTKKTMTFCLK